MPWCCFKRMLFRAPTCYCNMGNKPCHAVNLCLFNLRSINPPSHPLKLCTDSAIDYIKSIIGSKKLNDNMVNAVFFRKGYVLQRERVVQLQVMLRVFFRRSGILKWYTVDEYTAD